MLTTSDPNAISGIGGGISVEEAWVGAGKSPHTGGGVGVMLAFGSTRAVVGAAVEAVSDIGGSVIAGAGVVLFSALTVATTLVSRGSGGKGF